MVGLLVFLLLQSAQKPPTVLPRNYSSAICLFEGCCRPKPVDHQLLVRRQPRFRHRLLPGRADGLLHALHIRSFDTRTRPGGPGPFRDDLIDPRSSEICWHIYVNGYSLPATPTLVCRIDGEPETRGRWLVDADADHGR